MKTKILFLSICATIHLSVLAQRNVHWVHGLGGDTTSWLQFAGDFNGQRQIVTNTNNDYPTGDGVGGMVANIQTQIGGTAGGNSIGICHSMGGVAGRQLDVQNTGFFGGIITFGSPLRGARVVNNVNNGVASQYISNATSKLLQGPTGGIWGVFNGFFDLIGSRNINDFAGDNIINSVRNNLNLTPQTTNDLAEESGYNQGFYGNSTGTPKLVLWGNENSPIHVRLAAGSQNANEEQWVNAWNDARQFYGFKRDVCEIMKWTNFVLFPLWNWRANNWATGYNYLLDQSENEWANLIGGGFTYQQTVTEYVFVGTNLADYDNCIVAANGDPAQTQICQDTYFQWVTFQVTMFGRDPTDGLVPRRSQIAENTAWSSNADVRELVGNNHQEMRRSDLSRGELDAAFNGNRANGGLFIPTR